MSLSAQTIRFLAMRHGMIEPFTDKGIKVRGRSAGLSSASYDMTINHDLTLGVNPAFIFQKHLLDGYDFTDPADLAKLAYDLRNNPPMSSLAHTVEDLRMPNYVDAEVMNKSSNARVFCRPDNTYVDPGFHGNLTLELANHSAEPITLKKGDPIVQIVFSFLDMPTEQPYDGQYQHQTKGSHPARRYGVPDTMTASTSASPARETSKC